MTNYESTCKKLNQFTDDMMEEGMTAEELIGIFHHQAMKLEFIWKINYHNYLREVSVTKPTNKSTTKPTSKSKSTKTKGK